jgi:excisionase family DNA binding protein
MSDLINAPEVARLCGVNETTIRKNATNGSLGFKGVKIGGLWKFSRAEILEHLQKLKN